MSRLVPFVLVGFLFACTTTPPQPTSSPLTFRSSVIQSTYRAQELTKRCDQAVSHFSSTLKGKLNAVGFDRSWTKLINTTQPLTFMGRVATDAETRSESGQCKTLVDSTLAKAFSNKRLFRLVKTTAVQDMDQERLVVALSLKFKKSGATLSSHKLQRLQALRAQLSNLEAQYLNNIKSDDSTIVLTADDLSGVDTNFLDSLKQINGGATSTSASQMISYTIPLTRANVREVLTYAQSAKARQDIFLAYYNRAVGQNNDPILSQATLLRTKIARLFGYSNWADFQLAGNIARNSKTVTRFLAKMKTKLKPLYNKQLHDLLGLKKQIDPTATSVKPWDVRYLTNQTLSVNFQLGDRAIQKYLPEPKVFSGVASIFSKLFSIRIQKVTGAKVWAPGVDLYAVTDLAGNRVIGYFYTDFLARPDKEKHSVVYSLIQGRQARAGYLQPVSAMVENFNASSEGQVVLLNLRQVRSLFGEFGRVMQQILTRAPFGFLSGSRVAKDFALAPSQMFENWLTNADILRQISGYYKNPTQPMPDDLIAKTLAVEKYERNGLPIGYYYRRQLVLALTDMALYTSTGEKDSVQTYSSFKQIMLRNAAETYCPLWSAIYASDMFSTFHKAGLLNSDIGVRFRTAILEQGNMLGPLNLISTFLGRQPNDNAFLASLGLR